MSSLIPFPFLYFQPPPRHSMWSAASCLFRHDAYEFSSAQQPTMWLKIDPSARWLYIYLGLRGMGRQSRRRARRGPLVTGRAPTSPNHIGRSTDFEVHGALWTPASCKKTSPFPNFLLGAGCRCSYSDGLRSGGTAPSDRSLVVRAFGVSADYLLCMPPPLSLSIYWSLGLLSQAGYSLVACRSALPVGPTSSFALHAGPRRASRSLAASGSK